MLRSISTFTLLHFSILLSCTLYFYDLLFIHSSMFFPLLTETDELYLVTITENRQQQGLYKPPQSTGIAYKDFYCTFRSLLLLHCFISASSSMPSDYLCNFAFISHPAVLQAQPKNCFKELKLQARWLGLKLGCHNVWHLFL